MSAALGLLRLQQVDSRMDQLETELGRIRAELDDDAVAGAARQAKESAEAEQGRIEAGRRAAEGEATSTRIKLRQAEATLYGGSVRNPKELQDLQSEVASLKKYLVTLDAQEIGWMEQLEAADVQFRAADAGLKTVVLDVEARHRQLQQRQHDLSGVKESLVSERAAAADTLKPEWRTSYDALRRTRRGVAVVSVDDGACGACGTALTPAMQQNVRHGLDLVHCPACGRILYAD